MILKNLKKDKAYYFFLILFLFISSVGIYYVNPNRVLQILIFLVLVYFYIGLGILHHLLNHDLTLKIVLEYIFIGAMGLSIMFFVLWGGFGL